MDKMAAYCLRAWVNTSNSRDVAISITELTSKKSASPWPVSAACPCTMKVVMKRHNQNPHRQITHRLDKCLRISRQSSDPSGPKKTVSGAATYSKSWSSSSRLWHLTHATSSSSACHSWRVNHSTSIAVMWKQVSGKNVISNISVQTTFKVMSTTQKNRTLRTLITGSDKRICSVRARNELASSALVSLLVCLSPRRSCPSASYQTSLAENGFSSELSVFWL